MNKRRILISRRTAHRWSSASETAARARSGREAGGLETLRRARAFLIHVHRLDFFPVQDLDCNFVTRECMLCKLHLRMHFAAAAGRQEVVQGKTKFAMLQIFYKARSHTLPNEPMPRVLPCGNGRQGDRGK